MKIDRILYSDRTVRTTYLNDQFGEHITGKTLDVGCDEAPLRKMRPDLDYTGIDMGGAPDMPLNLEEIERLPFDDQHFDTVICCDVLEHLDNFHFIFAELLRVCRDTVIISLPNCWYGARVPIRRGRGDFAHYGLPMDKPVDRHKWFFSLTEARRFLAGRAERAGLPTPGFRAAEKPKPAALRALRRLRYPDQAAYLNRYAHTLWAVIKAAC